VRAPPDGGPRHREHEAERNRHRDLQPEQPSRKDRGRRGGHHQHQQFNRRWREVGADLRDAALGRADRPGLFRDFRARPAEIPAGEDHPAQHAEEHRQPQRVPALGFGQRVPGRGDPRLVLREGLLLHLVEGDLADAGLLQRRDGRREFGVPVGFGFLQGFPLGHRADDDQTAADPLPPGMPIMRNTHASTIAGTVRRMTWISMSVAGSWSRSLNMRPV